MPGYFNLWTVLLSFLIASFAGFVAFESILHTRFSPHPAFWTLMGGIALGGGIWSMHFVGMVAWHPPYPLYYSLGDTLLSILAALAASCVAMHITVNHREGTPQRNLVGGAVLVGLGICAMHYLGMAALHFTERPMWSTPGVLLSILIAIFASMGAMVMLQSSGGENFNMGRQVAASFIIGIAICGMHYTGMLAMMLPGGSRCVQMPNSFSGMFLAQIGVGVGLVFTVTLLVIFYRGKRSAVHTDLPVDAV